MTKLERLETAFFELLAESGHKREDFDVTWQTPVDGSRDEVRLKIVDRTGSEPTRALGALPDTTSMREHLMRRMVRDAAYDMVARDRRLARANGWRDPAPLDPAVNELAKPEMSERERLEIALSEVASATGYWVKSGPKAVVQFREFYVEHPEPATVVVLACHSVDGRHAWILGARAKPEDAEHIEFTKVRLLMSMLWDVTLEHAERASPRREGESTRARPSGEVPDLDSMLAGLWAPAETGEAATCIECGDGPVWRHAHNRKCRECFDRGGERIWEAVDLEALDRELGPAQADRVLARCRSDRG